MTRILTIIALLFAIPMLAACTTPQKLMERKPSFSKKLSSVDKFVSCYEVHYVQTNHFFRKINTSDGGVILQLFSNDLFGNTLASIAKVDGGGFLDIFVDRLNYPFGVDHQILDPITDCANKN